MLIFIIMDAESESESIISSGEGVQPSFNATSSSIRTTSKQHQYWIFTIPDPGFDYVITQAAFKDLVEPTELAYIRGQLESGAISEYLHWQVVGYFSRKVSFTRAKSLFSKHFGDGIHLEPTRSDAARQYVWKDDTAISGTRFEFGQLPVRVNSKVDWSLVRSSALSGDFTSIPDRIFISHYGSLRRIASDYGRASPGQRLVRVYWGPTGTGKSHRAWLEATFSAYPKGPTSKFWDGYQGESSVVLDEFRGQVEISHLLRWTDKYPVLLEIKGAAVPLKYTRLWITSNLHPRDWYPTLDNSTYLALERRLEIIEVTSQDQEIPPLV